MPKIIERSCSGLSVMSLETVNFDRRIVNIHGNITQSSAFEFALSLQYLNSVSETEPILVMVNSPGGNIDAGMLMYDAIQTSPAPVRLVVLGSAFSMAALLFASGQHGRYMLTNSKLMLHEPLLGCSIGGNTSSIKTISDNLLATREKINRILAKHTGKTKAAIERITKHERFFTAQESVKLGMADKVITFGELVKECG